MAKQQILGKVFATLLVVSTCFGDEIVLKNNNSYSGELVKFLEGEKILFKALPSANLIVDITEIKNLTLSNGIVIVENMITLGIGTGQPSRVDSSKIAINKASKVKNSTKKTTQYLENAVMASDAFFPFADGIDEAITKGVKSIIQPGGSINDPQVIDLANKRKISMVFTGIRSFKH